MKNETTEELLERARRQIEWGENLKRSNFEIFDKFLEYGEYETKVKYFPIGGFLKCKECGKTFKWKEWGRGMRIAISRMCEHLRFDEKVKEPVLVYYCLELWIENKLKGKEKPWIK